MKTIYLVRHAQAVPQQKNLPDAQRPLLKKGEKSAAAMAKKMKKNSLRPDHWISSTANRAVETAHIFANGLGRSIHKIQIKETIYSADRPDVLAEVVKNQKNKHRSVIIFGHNPLLSNLATYFDNGFCDILPKTGLAVIDFDVSKWSEISEGGGRIVQFDYPGRETKLYDRMQRDLRNHIQIELTSVLAKLDEPAALKSQKIIKTVSKTLAKDFIKTIHKQRIKGGGKMHLEHTLDAEASQSKEPTEAALKTKSTADKKSGEKPPEASSPAQIKISKKPSQQAPGRKTSTKQKPDVDVERTEIKADFSPKSASSSLEMKKTAQRSGNAAGRERQPRPLLKSSRL